MEKHSEILTLRKNFLDFTRNFAVETTPITCHRTEKALGWICCDRVELENGVARLVEPEVLVKWFHGTEKKKKK